MTPGLRRLLFACFVLSGFSGLVYQIVWVRMALASFGVITPFASLVVSTFMLGLALGTWSGGRSVHRISQRLGVSPLMLYAVIEGAIGLSAFVLPPALALGRTLLLPIGGMDGFGYLALSSLFIAIAMLPFCFCMGLTFPVMMGFIQTEDEAEAGSFSWLYLANVIGAFIGAVATPLVLIELFGFASSLHLAALSNFIIAAAAAIAARGRRPLENGDDGALANEPSSSQFSPPTAGVAGARAVPCEAGPRLSCVILFGTGFVSMALEIVWMRAFTPILGTLVYAFSGLLAVYLLATFIGSALYRRHRTQGRVYSTRRIALLLPIATLLPLFVAMPAVLTLIARPLMQALKAAGSATPGWAVLVPITLLSIAPLCALLGYLTPRLVDSYSGGRPDLAGRAYAINIAGSILGPLAAAYILLPWVGARGSMLLLALPPFALFGLFALRPGPARTRIVAAVLAPTMLIAFVYAGVYGHSFEEGSHIREAVVRRDHTATVISYGEGFQSHLLVNGYGMTVLTTLTKIMAHLPLATLDHEPKRALVIAFGMGTTFRSLLSWGIDATAVELVPSVVGAFEEYHDDATSVRANPRAHLVIDDGRRFLARTDLEFDVITLDPPPPVETAGSSLLYAREFYDLAKRRLAPGGIVHQWFPDGIQVEPAIRHAVLRSALDAFPHVRIFQSHHGFGLHILCSMEPIEIPAPETFIERLPPSALADLMEWAPPRTRPADFIAEQVLDRELALDSLVGPQEGPFITDDRPFNEYFVLRRLRGSPARAEAATHRGHDAQR